MDTQVLTGTEPFGHALPVSPLGGPFGRTGVGESNSTIAFWVNDVFSQPSTDLLPVYAISQVLIVPQAVPEPSGMLLLGTAPGAAAGLGRRRDRRGRRMASACDRRYPT